MEYKIYNYASNVRPEDTQDTPYDLDYNILGLHKKRDFVKGELVKVSYYGEYDYETKEYSDLVLEETRIYNRDKNSLVYRRDMEVVWYLSDDSKGDSKKTEKFYSPDESINEGEKRRSNIVSRLKLEVLGILGPELAYSFLSEVFTELGLYRDGFRNALISKIDLMEDAYLLENIEGTEIIIKDYLISELTF